MVRIMVFKATFNNISAILWPSISLVKIADLSQITGKIVHIMLYRVFELTTSVVIRSDCIGNYKANSHTNQDHADSHAALLNIAN